MTDNEKRAHDIAVAAINIQYENVRHISGTFDVYSCYKTAYELILESIRKDYPDGN